MGSVVLSEKYVDRLEKRVETFEAEVDERRQEVSLLNDRIDALQEFALASEPRLIGGSLAGEQIVVFEVDGTDEVLLEDVSETIEDAGGTVVTTITLTDRFGLADQPERDQLALILGSVSGEAKTLREEAGRLLGLRAAAAATPRFDGARSDNPPAQRLAGLLEQLEDAGFVGITSSEDEVVPPGASFVVAGGSEEPPRGGARDLAMALGAGIVDAEGSGIVAEAGASTWGLASSIRDDGVLSAALSTVDHADTVPGRISVVLGLDLVMEEGVAGHYGTDDGATEIVPPPTPRD